MNFHALGTRPQIKKKHLLTGFSPGPVLQLPPTRCWLVTARVFPDFVLHCSRITEYILSVKRKKKIGFICLSMVCVCEVRSYSYVPVLCVLLGSPLSTGIWVMPNLGLLKTTRALMYWGFFLSFSPPLTNF